MTSPSISLGMVGFRYGQAATVTLKWRIAYVGKWRPMLASNPYVRLNLIIDTSTTNCE